MRRALVTGGAGFVGRHMVAELERRGWHVDIVDSADPQRSEPFGDAMHLFRQDVTVYDLVVHAAARAPHRAAIDTQPAAMLYNSLLDAAMFEWALRTGQRVLYLSSSAVYPADLQHAAAGNRLAEADVELGFPTIHAPHDAYGWTKLHGERMAESAAAAGLAVHIVRPFSGYGEDQSELFPFGAFVARARRREDPFVVWGDGTQVRDWIHIDDVVAGALAVVAADERRPVNLGTGVGMSMDAVVETICAAAGYQPAICHETSAPAGVGYRVADTARMRAIYEPRVTLDEGVARALAQVRA